MEQVIINVDNPSILPSLRKVLKALDGVTIVPNRKRKKSGIEEADEDVKAGRVYTAASVEEMFDQILK